MHLACACRSALKGKNVCLSEWIAHFLFKIRQVCFFLVQSDLTDFKICEHKRQVARYALRTRRKIYVWLVSRNLFWMQRNFLEIYIIRTYSHTQPNKLGKNTKHTIPTSSWDKLLFKIHHIDDILTMQCPPLNIIKGWKIFQSLLDIHFS